MKSTTFSLVYFFYIVHFACGVEPNVRVEQEKETERWGTCESIQPELPTPELA